LGAALRAILCSAGQNIRWLLRQLRHIYFHLLRLVVGIIGVLRLGAV